VRAAYSCKELTSDNTRTSSFLLRSCRDFLCGRHGSRGRWLLWSSIHKHRHYDLRTRCGLSVGLHVQSQGCPRWLLQTRRSELWATPGRGDANRWYTHYRGQCDQSGYCRRWAFRLGRRCEVGHGRSRAVGRCRGQRVLGRCQRNWRSDLYAGCARSERHARRPGDPANRFGLHVR
jgi:hypothetical protein